MPISRADLSAFHQAIEFGNRTLTGVVLIASLGTFLLIWRARPRRPGLMWLALVLPLGVLFQAVWGGITVLTGLAWWTVAPHMLVSLLLLFVSIVVLVRLGETDDPPVPVIPRPLQVLTWVDRRRPRRPVHRGHPGDSGRPARWRRRHPATGSAGPGPRAGASVLDLGCNEGFFCGEALRQGAARVVGIDANQGFLARAAAGFPAAEFRTARGGSCRTRGST